MKEKYNLSKSFKCLFVLVCIVSLVCIPFSNGALAATYATPKINSFTATPQNVSSGSTTILKWDVVNATTIEIKGLEKTPEELPLSGSLEVWPATTTTYVLIATGSGGTTSQSVTVNVDVTGPAKIDSFSASTTEIVLGNTFVLSWKTSNALKISITGLEKQPEELPVNGSLEVWPTATTTYVLQAVGKNGEVVSKALTVNVVKPTPAKINSFTASATTVNSGDKVTLSWDVSSATSIAIKNVQTGLAAKGSTTVTPTQSTTYILSAIGTDGVEVTKSITITVNSTTSPQILSFTSSATTVTMGTLVTLTWTTKNVVKCTLTTSSGAQLTNRPANGSISVTPNSTTTYTLIAYDKNNVSTKKSITITVK